MTAPTIGVTENISESGIAFLTGAQVNVGARITLDVYLRPLNPEARAVQLRAEGIVVRVETLGISTQRVAAFVRFHEDAGEGIWETVEGSGMDCPA